MWIVSIFELSTGSFTLARSGALHRHAYRTSKPAP
jgi:hypothetical protein